MGLFNKRNIKSNDKDKNTKIKMVDITQLRFDREFKAVFQQETDKVTEIANDIKQNGFDKTRPIVVTEAFIIVDGYSRFMAAKKAGLSKVPIIIKQFESRDATIEYEYKMQLNSRRLTAGEYFEAFIKLDEFRKSDPNASGKNEISLNKAYESLKSKEKAAAANSSSEAKTESQTGKGINSDSFKLGVLFVLSELEKGKKKNQIAKDKRIAKLALGELSLNEEEISRISQRFGIA